MAFDREEFERAIAAAQARHDQFTATVRDNPEIAATALKASEAVQALYFEMRAAGVDREHALLAIPGNVTLALIRADEVHRDLMDGIG